jgi:hypothetical protein
MWRAAAWLCGSAPLENGPEVAGGRFGFLLGRIKIVRVTDTISRQSVHPDMWRRNARKTRTTPCPHGDIEIREGLRLFCPEAALIAASARFLTSNSTDIRTVLLTIRDASGLLARLPEGAWQA